MPGGVPRYEHSSQRPKTTKLVSQLLRRAIYLDPSVLATTSTLTLATLANPSHNSRVSRVHPPSRATTQEMLFGAATQGIPRDLTPIPSHNSRDTFWATTQGTLAILPLKHHQKPCRSRLQNQQPKVATAKLLSEGHVPPGAASVQTAWRVTRTARHQAPLNHQLLQPPPGGTTYTTRRMHPRKPLILQLSPVGTSFTTRHLAS